MPSTAAAQRKVHVAPPFDDLTTAPRRQDAPKSGGGQLLKPPTLLSVKRPSFQGPAVAETRASGKAAKEPPTRTSSSTAGPWKFSQAALGLHPWVLDFGDRKLERLYRTQVADQVGQSMVWANAAVISCGVFSLCGNLLAGETVQIASWRTAIDATHNLFWVLTLMAAAGLTALGRVKLARAHRLSIEHLTSWFAGVAICCHCFFGSRARAAGTFGLEPHVELGDQQLPVHGLVLLAYLAVSTHMRFKVFLFPLVSTAISYAIAMVLGLARSDPEIWISRIEDFACRAALLALILLGQRQAEASRRRALVERLSSAAHGERRKPPARKLSGRKVSKDKSNATSLAIFKDVETMSILRSEQSNEESQRSFASGSPIQSPQPASPAETPNTSPRSSRNRSLREKFIAISECAKADSIRISGCRSPCSANGPAPPLDHEALVENLNSLAVPRPRISSSSNGSGHGEREVPSVAGSKEPPSLPSARHSKFSNLSGSKEPPSIPSARHSKLSNRSGSKEKACVAAASSYNLQPCTLKVPSAISPNPNLLEAMPPSHETDWQTLDRAVRRIRDPSYTLKEFHQDMVTSFPELGLYTYRSDGESDEGEGASEAVLSSGRSRAQELARTFGAFYALFWLMRLDSDGRQGFCFGYDDQWALQPVPSVCAAKGKDRKQFREMTPEEKRLNFYHNFPWPMCEALLVGSGMVRPCAGEDGAGAEQSKVQSQVDFTRFRAMLVLTAIHDVMKNESLCPTVQPEHAPFNGYKAGEVILDHDVALDYTLTFFGDLFPSYRGLDPESQRLIRFTQGKMGFNYGWLVQGESPPGALFLTFKQLISSGGAKSEDVGFYFAHWVTDLAGAEPTPMSGSEKLVLKMPDHVLASFFMAFPHVWKLSSLSETQVFQDYLRSQWSGEPRLGPLPSGDNAVALMRLALHIQGNREALLPAFAALESCDQQALAQEMARTGLHGQSYEGQRHLAGCPALLVYYAPAFLQRNQQELQQALTVLAEVYRKGRDLFPLDSPAEESPGAEAAASSGGSEGPPVHTVTIRIEQIKDVGAGDVCAPCPSDSEACHLFLVKKNPLEAVLERQPLTAVNEWLCESVAFRLLELPPAAEGAD